MWISTVAGPFFNEGEETMAFASDANGEVESWTELEVATGPGSRASLLAAMGGLA